VREVGSAECRIGVMLRHLGKKHSRSSHQCERRRAAESHENLSSNDSSHGSIDIHSGLGGEVTTPVSAAEIVLIQIAIAVLLLNAKLRNC
jgi:hypothetical protein